MLRVIQPGDGEENRPVPPYLSTWEPVRFGSGFSVEEEDEWGWFRWMSHAGRLEFEPSDGERYLELGVYSEFFDLSQVLAFEAGSHRENVELVRGWAPVSIRIPAGEDHLDLSANKEYPREFYPGDDRVLAVRARLPLLHGDAARHRHIRVQQANNILNMKEMLAGETVLRSTAPILGVDLHGACNIDPPCVYCEWDANKALEGDNTDAPFTRETLEEWAEHFDNAASLINCGIGEPFLMRNLDELLDIFGDSGKTVEMATNGQILTERNCERLVGRDVRLYISLDAATPETYAKLRNQHFDKILVNLRRLIEAKGGRKGLPRIYMVFMPMKANAHELEAFIELCAELDVDRIMLRPLNDSFSINLDWERAGYHFEYQDELLPFERLVEISARAAELCRRHGVELSDQLDFGGRMEDEFAEEFAAARGASDAEHSVELQNGDAVEAPRETDASLESEVEPPVTAVEPAVLEPAPHLPEGSAGETTSSLGEDRLPLCVEPWRNFYILRRGVVPCCYGSRHMAEMDGYREAWNGDLMQSIRGELAAGRLHNYCLKSPACPIVRKHEYTEELTRLESTMLQARRAWHRFDRVLGGVPGRIYGPTKRGLIRMFGGTPTP